MHSLMSFQSIESGEILFTSDNVTAIGAVLGMNSHMDLETVRIEKSLPTIFFGALESILSCCNQIACRDENLV